MKRMKRRFLALLLCFAMILNINPAFPVQASGNISVLSGENAVESIVLPQNEKVQLTADESMLGAGEYQWQILAYDSIWVDIAGANGETLDLSYAMVASLLSNDEATVRCKVVGESGECYSSEVSVVIDYETAIESAEEVEEIEHVNTVNENSDNSAGAGSDYESESDSGSDEQEKQEDDYDVATDSDSTEKEEAEDSENSAKESYDTATDSDATEKKEFQTATDSDAEEEKDVEVSTSKEDENKQSEQSSSSNGAGLLGAAIYSLRDASVPSTYSIMIQYVFADGSQAANPWTATVAAGSDFAQTVNSPSVLGYTPDQANVELSYTSVDADKTVTVTYSPAEVEYTVVHYQQNLDDDNYAVVESETRTGYTESAVGSGLAKAYTGFYALLYDTTTEIAADSSTIVEIYYDRYYYLMTFDLDGGYGTEPIYARYGAPIEVNNPTKAGFIFNGWTNNGTVVDSLPATMPASNTVYVAQWTAGNTTYDVVFWYENADDEHYSQAGVIEDVVAVAGSTVNGALYADTNFTGRDSANFTYSHADTNVTVNGDGSTVVNVYFTRNVYTLTFVMSGWASSCTVEIHQHSDTCYNLICTQEEHNHTTVGCNLGDNIMCGMEEHAHSSTCCKVEEHTHSSSCGWLFGYLCGKAEHTHGGEECLCTQVNHSHTDVCYAYDCGKVEHEHTGIDGNCYRLSCGKDEHYHSGNTCYLVVSRKYDADITDIWTSNPVKAVIDDGNAFKSSVTGDYYSFLEKIPEQNITLTASDDSGNKYTWYYYLEVLPGQDTTDLTIRTDGGKTYYLYNSASRNASSLGLTYDEDYFPITGFTQRDEDVPSFSNRVAYLYYVRNSYNLTFSNHGTTVTDKGGTFLYEADISGQNFIPDYPSTLEKDAYVFEGWYTSPFFGDTKFEFTKIVDEKTVNATMPANDLTLYARWVPKNHNVNIYLTDAMTSEVKIGDTQVVAHRELATNPYPSTDPEHPASDKYEFVGWFYMDGETEKAFDFSMPVIQDLELYAKWSSNVLMEYTIKYAVESAEDGSLTYIADDTTGSALAGTTKTFEAKAGAELDEGYQSGYFPTTNSHSLTIDIEDITKNTYTFIYVPKNKLPYTVMYLEYDGDYVYDGTETVLHAQKDAETRDAIITETFEPVTGYMPDAYQKRLVLSADESQNVIIFWYVKDDTHAPVQIIHYIQNAEGEGYQEYQSTSDLYGVINNTYSTDVLTISGYTYDHATANDEDVTASEGKVSGTVTKDGLILELYYNRNLYPYEFQFLEQGTNVVLADPVTGTARYGAQVTQNAKEIAGYDCVSSTVQAMTIQIEDGDIAIKNIRIFYYAEKEVTIQYVSVTPDWGSVSPASEIVKVMSGTAQGSAPTANEGYRFVGWFKDEACTQAVDAGWVDGSGHIIPGKTTTYGENPGTAGYEAATYYAKFERDVVNLTITKAGADSNDANQTFIFHVVGTSEATKHITMAVSVVGNGSVMITGLPVGTYKVSEDDSWSWRYTANDVTVELFDDKEVTINNTRTVEKWLDYNFNKDNRFKAKGAE